MKKNLLYLASACGLFALVAFLQPAGAQSQADESAQFLPLLQVVTQQQTALSENQDKIEASIARLQEELRQAKIYASRSGKK